MSKIEYPDMPPRAKTRKLFDKKTTFFSVVGLVMFLILVVLDFRRAIPPSQSQSEATTPQTSTTRSPGETWTPAHQRAYAQKLASKGLKKEAVTAFRQYLASPAIPLSELANVNYTMGKMLFDMADYEPALSAFYQAELAGASGDLKQEIDRKIVACLERLGKSFDAKAELDQRTSLIPSKSKDETRDLVVARIAEEPVTLGQINDELQKMLRTQPKLVADVRSDKTKLLEFIRQYVFERVLSRKARRLGLDQQPDFRKQMEEMMDRALAQVLIQQEIQSKVKIDPSNIKLYYDANKSRYVQPARATVRHILLDDEKKAKEVLDKATSGADFESLVKENSEDASTVSAGGLLQQPLIEGAPEIPGIGKSVEFGRAVFSTPDGQVVTKTLQTAAGFHVVKVDRIEPGLPLSFQEAQQRVAYDYQLEKTQSAINNMLQETLEVEGVQIFDSAIVGDKSSIEVKEK